jgi:hypothetical protein
MDTIRSSKASGRHARVIKYRREVYEKIGFVWFPHQADWQLATEGWTLNSRAPAPGEASTLVQLEDESIEPRAITPRVGGAARVASDLAAYKSGKSYSASAWATGFAELPDANVVFIGLEQINCSNEFDYLAHFLLSEEGMNLKYDVFRNDKREGKMWLRLANGAYFEVRSYKKRETLKGDKVDAYIYCEAYMMPGLQCYTSISQNLRERDGFAIFPTTPDSAWVNVLHEKAHGVDERGRPLPTDPHWHCTCDIDNSCNPYTYDQSARDRDDPDKGGLMTRERYRIAWQGKVGKHIGQVYDYDQAQLMVTPETHPNLWTAEAVEAYLETRHL